MKNEWIQRIIIFRPQAARNNENKLGRLGMIAGAFSKERKLHSIPKEPYPDQISQSGQQRKTEYNFKYFE